MLKDINISKQYINYNRTEMLSTARLVAVLLMFVSVGSFLGEYFFLHTKAFLFYRLIGFLAALVFLIYSKIFFEKASAAATVISVLTVHFSVSIMNCFIIYAIFTKNLLAPEFKSSVIMGAGISVLFQIVLSTGIKKWIHVVIFVPAFFLTIALIFAGVSANDMAVFSTYDITILAASVISIREGRLEIVNFINGLAEKEKNELLLKDKVKTEILSNVSHELRTPLTGIIGINELLSRTSLTDEQNELLSFSKQSSYHLLELINDLLDISKMDEKHITLKMEDVEIVKFSENILKKFITLDKKGLEFSFNTEMEKDLKISADSGKIAQILRNLLNNAEKFTDSGKITLSIYKNDETEDTVELKFAISDTGMGIPCEKIPFLFDRFYQIESGTNKKHAGTGLGLAISKMLVEVMGGKIGCESIIGQGSIFSFVIRFAKVKKVV